MSVSTRKTGRLAIACAALALSCLAELSAGSRTGKTSTDEEKGSHKQVQTLDLFKGREGITVHSFCLNRAGNLLATCSDSRVAAASASNPAAGSPENSRGLVCVISPTGKQLATWAVQVVPQAINVGPDGSVYCGGEGRVIRLDANGKTLRAADAPQVSELPPLPPPPSATAPAEAPEVLTGDKQARIAELRKETAAMQTKMREAVARIMKERGKKGGEVAIPEEYRKLVQDYGKLRNELRSLTVSPEKLAEERRRALMYTRRINAIAATDRDVFTVCPTSKGYGFDVWRTDTDFANPRKIVTGLRGCCGQMDIQTAEGKLYVAENARKQVVCYDREGVKLAAWGEADRSDVKGFGSCCNPMNIQFGPNGELYTVEAGLGRIKRYTPDGKFLGLVGKVKDVPSCKHNPVAITSDGARVFLLDPRKAKVLVLARTASPEN